MRLHGRADCLHYLHMLAFRQLSAYAGNSKNEPCEAVADENDGDEAGGKEGKERRL